jgi:hypothetical protein
MSKELCERWIKCANAHFKHTGLWIPYNQTTFSNFNLFLSTTFLDLLQVERPLLGESRPAWHRSSNSFNQHLHSGSFNIVPFAIDNQKIHFVSLLNVGSPGAYIDLLEDNEMSSRRYEEFINLSKFRDLGEIMDIDQTLSFTTFPSTNKRQKHDRNAKTPPFFWFDAHCLLSRQRCSRPSQANSAVTVALNALNYP